MNMAKCVNNLRILCKLPCKWSLWYHCVNPEMGWDHPILHKYWCHKNVWVILLSRIIALWRRNWREHREHSTDWHFIRIVPEDYSDGKWEHSTVLWIRENKPELVVSAFEEHSIWLGQDRKSEIKSKFAALAR